MVSTTVSKTVSRGSSPWGYANLLMAFLLVVIVDGEPEPTANMYFRNINRCNYFSERIERGRYGKSYRGFQAKITAYCTPRMVPQETAFWD